ncbi:MAG: radical SAM protein [Candidatus Latescibacteria bacterium]|nr:radical SAM protein [Candidatus Latescibacterota bacterium]NIO56809.1 radical SAM protein [Candidatus Latescibacterota bacterium]
MNRKSSQSKKQTRRNFIKSWSYFALAGLGSLFIGRRAKSDPEAVPLLFDILDQAEEAPDSSGAAAKIDPAFEPAYLKLHKSGELKKRGEELWGLMKSCELCPRECGASRLDGEEGFCQASSQLEISSYHPHFGEERPLVGKGGSGTVFFTNCGLRCVFCINWEISQGGQGAPRTIEDLASMMLRLQEMGCHNINVVTPTHYSPHIVLAVDVAAGSGLRLPIVYNTCGWERQEILKKLDGIVDIYLPDFKYADGEMAAKYSSDADTYPEVTQASLLEMNRQVGVAKPAADGLMYRGLMIRHLVMPNNVGGTKKVIEWIAQNLPKDTYFNIMSQYRPMHKAFDYPKISRRITRKEYSDAVKWAKEAGLTNLDIQGYRF